MEPTPDVPDRFWIERSLGTGGFGVVYAAFDRQRHARVALKLLRRADPAGLFRLKHEFRTLADLSHPNLVTLHELVADREPWFIAMELVEGQDFLAYVDRESHAGHQPQDSTTLLSLAPPDEETGSDVFIPPPPRLSRSIVCDLDRLQMATPQLVEALAYLHAAGKLHCDIKPSNVLVRRDGILKLLDFGLAAELGPAPAIDGQPLAGTPAYMSPEQASSASLTPGSDWYSVGVMLFEALTGQRPFMGEYHDMLRAKLTQDGPRPSALVGDIPGALDDLVGALLTRAPSRRPDGAEVLATIRRLWPRRETTIAAPASLPRSVFVGREGEMQALVEAAAAAGSGHAVVAHVHGSSGMGKTALVTRFLQQLRERSPETTMLVGRCYEREAVPYKALDGIVDELSQYLRRLGRSAETLVPRDVAALARLFPVLRRVEAIALSRDRSAEIADSQELRRRGFAAFRDLIARLAAMRPVVLFIDDLHWGDTDSAALLINLLRPPDAPPVLLIVSYRTEEAATSSALRMFLSHVDAPAGHDVREVAIHELTEDQARDLTVRLMGGDRASRQTTAIVRESGRSPFFISELVRYGGADDEAKPGLTLEAVLAAQAARLPPPARRLLDIVAVFGRPLRTPLASRAANLGADELDAMTALRSARLARVRVTEAGKALEVYHDRIRETIVGRIAPDALSGIHGTLAHVLEAERDADPETLFVHFQGAGERDRAAKYATVAGDRARDALAFDRAAELYRHALALTTSEPAACRNLQVKLGDALAASGRGHDAAGIYLEAAAAARPSAALELRRRAAEQLLRSGHLEEGYRVVHTVLDAMGMKLATSPVTALASLLWRRLQIRLRGLRFTPRDAAEIPPEALVRVDACWSVATALGVVDTIRGADFQGRHLLLALQIGDRYRVARALAVEAVYAAVEGEHARARYDRLIERADALAQETQHPQAIALVAMVRGASAFLQGRWSSARELLERAEPLLREKAGAWQIDTHIYHLYYLLTLFNLGEVADVSRRVPLLVAEAQERDDLTAATSLRTRAGYLPPLALDDPATARREVKDAMSRWPTDGFHAQHSWELYARGEIDLYAGCSVEAWQFITDRWPSLRKSMLLRIQGTRIESLYLRGRAAVAASRDERMAASDRRERLKDAERDASALSRESAAWAHAAAWSIRAGIAASRDDRARALAHFASAENAFRASDMALHAVVASRRRGELLGGEDGRLLVAAADAWMRAQGIRRPERMAAMLAPLSQTGRADIS